MKFKIFFKLCAFLLCIVTTNLSAQATEIKELNGLTKKSILDLGGAQLTLDGESIPIYLEDGKRIRGTEIMSALQDGGKTLDPYTNDKGDLKAIVIRKSVNGDMPIKIESNTQETKSVTNNEVAKNFKVVDITGKTYSLNDLKGKVVVINFWFTACKPCVMEMPELNALVKKYENKDVVFLAPTFDSKNDLKKFLVKKDFSYNIVPDAMSLIKEYGVSSYPTHIVIGKDSQIKYQTSGLSATTVSDIDALISKNL